jgi:hypothetical protein
MKLFLSYTDRDAKLGGEFKSALEKQGVDTLDYSHVRPGENWREKIIDGIKEADAVVVFVGSPAHLGSGWAGYEVGSASALDKDVWVLKPKFLSMTDLPADLKGYRTIDIDPAAPDKAVRSLILRTKTAA